MRAKLLLLLLSVTSGLSCTCRADDPITFLEFDEEDRDRWLLAIDETTVWFSELPLATHVTDQYAELGILFGGDINSVRIGSARYWTDGWGIDGNAVVEMHFDPPVRAILLDAVGDEAVEMFSSGRLVYESTFPGNPDAWGVVFRDVGIDFIRYWDPDGWPFGGNTDLDNVHFATELPDCDGDGEPDVFEIAEGIEPDCDGNAIPDACDIASGTADDCNGNGVPDGCEVAYDFAASSVVQDLTPFVNVHEIGPVPEAAGPVTVWGWAMGDLDEPAEFAVVTLNTAGVGLAWMEAGPGCAFPQWWEASIPAATFNAARAAGGGSIEIRFQFSGAVDPHDCNEEDFLQSGVIYLAARPNDTDANGIPDDCQCPADLDRDGAVGFSDLLALLAAWGECEKCPEDLDHDGEVGFADLLAVLAAWGACG